MFVQIKLDFKKIWTDHFYSYILKRMSSMKIQLLAT